MNIPLVRPAPPQLSLAVAELQVARAEWNFQQFRSSQYAL